jgi:hypothetical protein
MSLFSKEGIDDVGQCVERFEDYHLDPLFNGPRHLLLLLILIRDRESMHRKQWLEDH